MAQPLSAPGDRPAPASAPEPAATIVDADALPELALARRSIGEWHEDGDRTDGRAPSSLLMRTSGVLAVAGLFIAVSTLLLLNVYVFQPLAGKWAADQAALVVLSAQTWVELPPESRAAYELELAKHHDLIIEQGRSSSFVSAALPPHLAQVAAALHSRLGGPVPLQVSDDLVWAEIPMSGSVLQIGFSDQREDVSLLSPGLLILMISAAVVLLTAMFIVGRVARPLMRTASAAASFRGGTNLNPLPEQGPRELVQLARSFNEMAADISALMANRTTLLAGISHDLRTPLARMRLAVELLAEDNVDQDLLKRLERNLEEMDDLLGVALRFARGLAEEEPERIDLATFLVDLLAPARDRASAAGAAPPPPVRWHGQRPFRMPVAVGSLRRVLQNLLVNAARYGDGPAEVAVEVAAETVTIAVLDRGPGIPLEHMDDVFQPFFRLERSRSNDKGGSGLGLAIVKQLCQAHGWRVHLAPRLGGGLVALVVLPRATDA